MAGLLQEFAQAQLARDAAQELAGFEVDGARRGRRLSVGIFRDPWDVVAGIFLGIAVDRIVIENTNHLGHVATPSCHGPTCANGWVARASTRDTMSPSNW